MFRIDRLINQLQTELRRLEFLPFANSDQHSENTELIVAVLGGVSCADTLCEVSCGPKKSSLPKLTLLNGRRLVLNTSSVLAKDKTLHRTNRLGLRCVCVCVCVCVCACVPMHVCGV
jgi:hypothetical protein